MSGGMKHRGQRMTANVSALATCFQTPHTSPAPARRGTAPPLPQCPQASFPRQVEVHFIVASCENMVDGKGLRPGDILTASNGKTVEVNNTDAEGRLTLADAIIYAEKVRCGADLAVGG